MKKKTFYKLTGAAIAILTLAGCAGIPGFGPKITEIKSFRFSYQVGNYMNASVSYELKLTEDGTYTARIKPAGTAEEDAETFTVTR